MTGRTCAFGSCKKVAEHRLRIIPEGGSGSAKRARVEVCGDHVETVRKGAVQMMEAVLSGFDETPASSYRIEEVDQPTAELER